MRDPIAAPLILLADPSRDDRDMYAEYLLAHGFRVALSDDSAEALELAFELRPALVCASSVLGDRIAVQLCAALNADDRTRHIPVIILSTRRTDAALAEVRGSGCDAVVIKPCLPRLLVGEIRRVLKLSHPPRREVRTPTPSSRWHPRPS